MAATVGRPRPRVVSSRLLDRQGRPRLLVHCE
jgi:hypothetical protein